MKYCSFEYIDSFFIVSLTINPTINPNIKNRKRPFKFKYVVKPAFSEHFSSDSLCNFLYDFEKRVVNGVKT
jgi:hypothetical protein